MISDLDGANLRAYLAAHGGRTSFRATSTSDPHEIQTGRSGVITASRPPARRTSTTG
jgi:hypothetical protein